MKKVMLVLLSVVLLSAVGCSNQNSTENLSENGKVLQAAIESLENFEGEFNLEADLITKDSSGQVIRQGNIAMKNIFDGDGRYRIYGTMVTKIKEGNDFTTEEGKVEQLIIDDIMYTIADSKDDNRREKSEDISENYIEDYKNRIVTNLKTLSAMSEDTIAAALKYDDATGGYILEKSSEGEVVNSSVELKESKVRILIDKNSKVTEAYTYMVFDLPNDMEVGGVQAVVEDNYSFKYYDVTLDFAKELEYFEKAINK